MSSDRGGILGGLLAAIGLAVVLLALALTVCVGDGEKGTVRIRQVTAETPASVLRLRLIASEDERRRNRECYRHGECHDRDRDRRDDGDDGDDGDDEGERCTGFIALCHAQIIPPPPGQEPSPK